MTRHADRPNLLNKGTLLVALCAAALLVLASGCGQFNDNPNNAGLSVRYQFEGSSGTSSASGTSTPQAIAGPIAGGPVGAVVIGAIVITHANGQVCTGGPICPYTDVSQINDANRDALQNDAEQSVQYLTLITLPFPTDTVEFPIPPQGAGKWQVAAIGLKITRTAVADVQTGDPSWYGFVPAFLNGTVLPGDTAPTLTLKPWCTADGGPIGTGGTISGAGTSCP